MATQISLSAERAIRVPLLVPRLPDAQALRPYLDRIDRNHWYSNFGPLVQGLETRLAATFGSPTPSVVTVSNATIGIELALRALALPVGALVLVPSFTFVATAIAVLSAGLTPLCCDVDPNTWQLTPDIARESVAKVDVRAVIPVCVFGAEQPGEGWHRFWAETGIPVVIDAAAAFGNQLDPGPTCAVFSMHATKPLASGEGGFVLSRSEEMVESIRQLSNFGINLHRPGAAIGVSTMIGVNAKLSEYHAAVGHASLDVWETSSRTRKEMYEAYSALLSAAVGDQVAWQAASAETVRSVCAFLMPSTAARDQAEVRLARQGVATRRWYCPTVDQHPAFSHIEHLPTPLAHRIAGRLLGLPFHLMLEEADMCLIASSLEDIQSHAR